jgi:hypothetical protein
VFSFSLYFGLLLGAPPLAPPQVSVVLKGLLSVVRLGATAGTLRFKGFSCNSFSTIPELDARNDLRFTGLWSAARFGAAARTPAYWIITLWFVVDPHVRKDFDS